MRDAKAHLGIRDEMPPRPAPTYKRPARPQCGKPKSRVLKWLLGRGLTEETIAAFKIGEQERGGKTYAVFPYLRDGELVNAKRRNPDEKKDMLQEGGAEPCLFGWHLIEPNARRVAIFEGEIDAMTGHQMGIASLSINAGAGNHQWIENDWERLQQFSDIVLCYDSDEAGQKGAREVAQRLGVERCRIATFGQAKDANEYLTEHKAGARTSTTPSAPPATWTPTNCDRCPISWAMWWRCSTRRTIPPGYRTSRFAGALTTGGNGVQPRLAFGPASTGMARA